MTFYQNGPQTLDALRKKMSGVSRFQHGNFYIEWLYLKEAITRAIAAIRAGEHFHDLDPVHPA